MKKFLSIITLIIGLSLALFVSQQSLVTVDAATYVNQFPTDGWVPAGDALTYASSTTVTCPGDRTDKYSVGMKMKFTQTTVKYFTITAVSYSSSTTITLDGSGSYTVANAAITSPYFSTNEAPLSFPTAQQMDGGGIGARVYNTAAISIGNSSWTVVTFDSERFDSSSLHSTSSNTSRITVPTTGVYLIVGHGVFAANATNGRWLRITVNGTTDIAHQGVPIASATYLNEISISAIYKLIANDYVEMYAFQNSGGSLNLTANSNYSPELAIYRLGM